MVKIYCIEDINDLKYVGATKQKLIRRFSKHKSNKKLGEGNCSSNKLNLEYSIIYELEECSEEDRHDRERYWINHLNSVNTERLNGVDKKRRYEKHKIYQREWQRRNSDKVKEYKARSKLKNKT